MLKRARRLRNNYRIRELVRETKIEKDSLIYPIFIKEGENIYEEIESMQGQYRYSIDKLYIILDKLLQAKVYNILLFGIPKTKDEFASEAFSDKGIIQESIRFIKKHYPQFFIIADVCMCEYTSHGHCGIVHNKEIDNDESLEYLAKISLSYAKAGADVLAPSDMMDGRIEFIRNALDDEGFINVALMSYAVKYASNFYGPFREAASSKPSFSDRKTYQMDYYNSKEAIKEIEMDIYEGADIIIIKPALAYLDIVLKASKFNLPIAAYSVSGEYAMIKSASSLGYINEDEMIKEVAISAFRAGANIYITYFALELAKYIDEGSI